MSENPVENDQESKNKVLDNHIKIVESAALEVMEVESVTESNILSLLSLVGEVTKKYSEMVEMCQTVEHNKEIHELLSKVEKTNIALNNLIIHKKENTEYFSEKNCTYLRRLITVIDKIRDISQLKGYKELLKNLNNEFDTIIRLLNLNLEVPFSNFLPRILEEMDFLPPLLSEMNNINDEIIEVYKTAEYIKETCFSIMKRVEMVDIFLRNLRDNRKENPEYFSKRNYITLHNFFNVINKMRKFITEISQLKGHQDYTQAKKNIEESFEYLNREFSSLVINLDISDVDYDKKIQANVEMEWIKKKINDDDIHYFEYSEFNDIETIGQGAISIVNRAVTNDGMQVALKGPILRNNSKVEEDDFKNFVKHLKLVRKVHFHSNITHFLGITKDNIGKYIMVLEYANNGNLRDYLKNKFDSLLWKDKIQMALDITCGLKCLHSKDIIHRDLCPSNILVNNGRLSIAICQHTTEASSNSVDNLSGVIKYTDPQFFGNSNYIRDKKSDIYSLGVLFWEITSGLPPFHNTEEQIILGTRLYHSDLREKPIEGTPLKYKLLYQKCWDSDPEKRPDIDLVYYAINQTYVEIVSQVNSNYTNERYEDDNNRDTDSDLYVEDEEIYNLDIRTYYQDYDLNIDKRQDPDDIIYNSIDLKPPIINSNVNNDASHFFTVDATISRGISADKHFEVEQLYNLLVDKKDRIEHVLKSQPVYFIGPNFHENYDFPCITCWVTEHLSISILEQLSRIFNDEFKVVDQILEPVDCELSENGTSGNESNGKKMSERKKFDRRKRDDNGEDGNNNDNNNDASGNDDGDDSDGDDDDGDGDDDDDDDGDRSGDKGKNDIKFSSIAFAECEEHCQEFVIRVRFNAKIDRYVDSRRKLSFEIDVTECRASDMLSQNSKQLATFGCGYFIKSFKIGVSPITNEAKNRSELYEQEYSFPKEIHRIVESTTNNEKQGSLELGASPKAGFQMRKSNNTKVTSNEWHLKTWGSSTTGDNWMYEKMTNDIFLSFVPGRHESKWLIISEKMRGFRVKITQVLCFNFTRIGGLNKSINPRPMLVVCPEIAHSLEINFNNLEDFNKKFMALECSHRGVEDLIITLNKTRVTNKTTKTNSGVINIERSVTNKDV